MATSRSEYVVRNASITLVMQGVKNVLAFISRTVFVYVLGAEYLGVNSLFTDILTVLSFAELGIGNAMVFSLYKPIAEHNVEKIKSLMRLYAKAYQIIGIVIAVLGICVVPFLELIVGNVSYVRENIIVLYLLFLLNSVISYFFVYKKSLIIADQKNYIVDIYQQIFYAVQVVLQSVFLVVTKQFICYLVIVVLCTFLNNVAVSQKANRMYPYLVDKNAKPLGKEEISDIISNVKALVVYKLGGIILESTDSIFISSLISVVTVGLYANYKMIINVFRTIGNQMMNSIVASVGNLNAGSDEAKKESVFYEMLFLSAWFYGLATAGLCCFLTPLVEAWLGSSYVIEFSAVVAACVYFYVSNMHYPCYTYRTTAGLFVYGKYIPLISAIINIVLDIVLGRAWGLAGILWASTISRALTYEIVDPLMVYRHVFHQSVRKYFGIYGVYTAWTIVDCAISYGVVSLLPSKGLLQLVVRAVVFALVYNLLFLLATYRTKSFRSISKRLKPILSKEFHKIKK